MVDSRFKDIISSFHVAQTEVIAGIDGYTSPVVAAPPPEAPKEHTASSPAHKPAPDYATIPHTPGQLFAAIEHGDAAKISAMMRATTIPGWKGEVIETVMDPGISVLPRHDKDPYHFPEPLLQRAIRAKQMPSVVALLDVARERGQWEDVLNAADLNGNTALHTLAESIPASYTPASAGQWNPAALLAFLLDNSADVLLTNKDAKTAGDLARNPIVHDTLKTLEHGEHEDEKSFTKQWQARQAKAKFPHSER